MIDALVTRYGGCILAVAALCWALPAAAQDGTEPFAAFLSSEEQRLCDLSTASDSTQEQIDAALANIARMRRVAQGEVRFLEMEMSWLGAGVAMTTSDVYQDVNADTISFATSAKLGGARGALSVAMSQQQAAYDNLYTRLQSDDPAQSELDAAGAVANSIQTLSIVLLGALLQELDLSVGVIKKGGKEALQEILGKVDPAIAERVLEKHRFDIDLIASYWPDFVAAQAALEAVDEFHAKAKSCLDGWAPPTASTTTGTSGCLPKADLWFQHPNWCEDENHRMKVTIETEGGDTVQYVDGCAFATYSRKDHIRMQLQIQFSSAQFTGDLLTVDPGGKFDGRFKVFAEEGQSNFAVGVEGNFTCGADGLPSELIFVCYAPYQQWAGEFYEAFGQGATVHCSKGIPRDKNLIKRHD